MRLRPHYFIRGSKQSPGFKIFTAVVIMFGVACSGVAESSRRNSRPTISQDCLPDYVWGSMTPYPDGDLPEVELPDSLRPVLLSHVGRHGARYLSGPKKVEKLLRILNRLQQENELNETGRIALEFTRNQQMINENRWGELDSLGRAEERGIGERMAKRFDALFEGGRIYAISSYVPRVVESMYSLTGAIATAVPGVSSSDNSGRQFSALMRFFETDSTYKAFIADGSWRTRFEAYKTRNVPTEAAYRLVKHPANLTEKEASSIVEDLYGLLQGVAARGETPPYTYFFTRSELEACARISNLEHYLRRTAHAGSRLSSQAASVLLKQMIVSADSALSTPGSPTALLRFGHAETIMPLLSLMNLPGCNAPDASDTDLIELWDAASVSPLGANLQLIYCRAPSGRIYVLTLHNERPLSPLPDSDSVIVAWDQLREYWESRLDAAE